MQQENLGPAERILQAIISYNDHAVHNRSGVVVPDNRFQIGVRWEPVTYKVEGDAKVVYKLVKAGKKTQQVKFGNLRVEDKKVVGPDNRTVIGEYREPGLYPEVATWLYKQVAEVWKLDNEFAAKWASYAFAQDHRDLKVILAAFMLVQSRKGDPVLDNGKVAFYDDDFRDIGEAMMLIREKSSKDKKVESRDLNPKLLLRIRDVLMLPEVAQINRELGFGNSARKPFLGRWPKAVEKWLKHREDNAKLLEGLVKAGFRKTVIKLAQSVGYKPTSPSFFETLRWKQSQSDDGRRTMAIGTAIKPADSWEGFSEGDVCQTIVNTKPNWKVIAGKLPKKLGITRAIMAAAIEVGSLSDKDLIIYTPTLEELGLLDVESVKTRWKRAVKNADDMRAANILNNVKSKAVKEKLQEAADTALQKVGEEVTKNLRLYFMVDTSGSMQGAIEAAKDYIAKFLPAFPLEKIHVSTFTTTGRVIALKHASAAGVNNAFQGVTAGGGTDYGAGVRCLQHLKPKDDEDVLFIFVGDEEASTFEDAVRASGLKPMAFGLLKVAANSGAAGWRARQYGTDKNVAVRETANRLGIPCFFIEDKIFDDVYAVPRTLRALVASTPVGKPVVENKAPRYTFVEQILRTALLTKPTWAA